MMPATTTSATQSYSFFEGFAEGHADGIIPNFVDKQVTLVQKISLNRVALVAEQRVNDQITQSLHKLIFDRPDENENQLQTIEAAMDHKVTCLNANESYLFVANEAPQLLVYDLRPDQAALIKTIALSPDYRAPSEVKLFKDCHAITLQLKENSCHLKFI